MSLVDPIATDQRDAVAFRERQHANAVVLRLEHPSLAPGEIIPHRGQHGRDGGHADLRRVARFAVLARLAGLACCSALPARLPSSRLSFKRAMRSTTWVLSRSSGSAM